MTALEIHLLGQFRVVVDGQAVDESRWSRKKSKVLLKQLALAPRRELHREQLIEALWPDADFESALNNLHKVVHAARRTLEPDLKPGSPSRFLLTQENLITLAPDPLVWVDAEAFDRKATLALSYPETASLEAAAELYAGDLLLEDLYEDWASVRREQLRLLHQRVLQQLAENYETAQDPRALEILLELVHASPVHEDAQRRLMKCYLATGRRDLALNQYRLCCEALRKELNAEPEPATVLLYEQMIAGTAEVERPESTAVVTPPEVPAEPAGVPPPPVAGQPPARRTKWILASIAAAIFVMSAAGWFVYRTRTVAIDSLAILPVAIETNTEQLAYVADGITEGLISRISQRPGIRVMARATVFTYRNKISDPMAVGRELHVTAVVTGRLSQIGNNLSLSAELVSVRDGARLWGRQFSVPANNLTSLPDALGSELESALQVKLTDEQRGWQQRRSSADAEAYRLYLVGRYHWNKRTAEGFHKAVESFQQAIDRDPTFALAYVGLADSYGLLGFVDGAPRDYFPLARAAAQRALELDDRLAEAHTSLAMVRALYDWDWAGAENEFRRSIDLNNGYATAHHWYGVHLGAMGRFDEASKELARALDLDPLSPIINTNCGYPLYYQRRFAEAMTRYRKALELRPGFAIAHEDLMYALAAQGDYRTALGEGVLFLEDSGQKELAAAVSDALDARGWQAAAKVWLEDAEIGHKESYRSPMVPAYLRALLGDRDQSLRWLEVAFENRAAPLIYVAVDPAYNVLSGDPRFDDLLRRLNLRKK